MPTSARKPILWFCAKDDRKRTWRVFISNTDLTPGLEKYKDGLEDHGYVDFAKRRVFINSNQSLSQMRVTAAHELNHVALADTALQFKEEFIEVHAVHHLPLMMSLGFRFPKVPRIPWRSRR